MINEFMKEYEFFKFTPSVWIVPLILLSMFPEYFLATIPAIFFRITLLSQLGQMAMRKTPEHIQEMQPPSRSIVPERFYWPEAHS